MKKRAGGKKTTGGEAEGEIDLKSHYWRTRELNAILKMGGTQGLLLSTRGETITKVK